MQWDQNREDVEVQVEVVRAAAALERERAARLREDAADTRWFARRLADMFRADRERLRGAEGRLPLAGGP